MHPVRTVTYELKSGRTPVYLDDEGPFGTLTYVDVAAGRLSYGQTFTLDEHPVLSSLEAHVLPEFGVRVVRFCRRNAKADDYAYYVDDDYDYYVDIVSVTEQGERWVVRDLYLDVLVFNGVRAKILDTDEYLAARAEGHMDAPEADDALLKLHEFLDGLARNGHSLERYLETQGVSLTWRR
jgi:predicted RNA-binding protein associated with RNAse of E/G family